MSTHNLIEFFKQLQCTYKDVNQLYQEFLRVSEKYNKDLSTLSEHSEDVDKIELTLYNKELVQSIMANPILPVAVCGPNSSGKSTLLNFLLGVNIMPSGSGHVTGRICRISYASIENSKLSFLKLVCDGSSNFKYEEVGNSIPLSNLSRLELTKLLKSHLTRGDIKNKEKNEIESWAKTIVHISYPFSILEPGFDFYDVPGTSKTDDPLIQKYLTYFLETIKPVVLFVYANPTISDAELPSLEIIRNSIKFGIELENRIFYASNHCDEESFICDKGWDGCDEITFWKLFKEEEQNRYDFLYARRLYTFVPEKMEEFPSFSCVSARDAFLKRGTLITNLFMDRLLNFIKNANISRVKLVLQELYNTTQRYFGDIIKLNYNDVNQLRIEAKHALDYLESMNEEGLTHILKVISTVPEKLNSKLLEVETQFLDKISQCETTCDNKNLLINAQKAKEELEEFAKNWIKENVIMFVFDEIKIEMEALLKKQFAELVSDMKDNEFIISALQNAFPNYNPTDSLQYKVGTGAVVIITYVSAAVIGFVVPGIFLGIVAALGTIFFLPLIGGLVLGGIVILVEGFSKVNAKFKKKIGKDILKSAYSSFATLSNINSTAATEFYKDFIDQLSKHIQHHLERLEVLDKSHGDWLNLSAKFEAEFGPLFAKITTTKYKLQFPQGIEKINKIGEGGFGEIWHCKWNERNVAVKFKKKDSLSMDKYFYREIFAMELLKTASYLLNYHAVFSEPEWFFIMPEYEMDLRKYLQENNTLEYKNRLKICLDVARGIQNLHSIGITHRDIKLENILVSNNSDINPEIVITDFGISTPSTNPVTTIGTTKYMAIEMFCNDNFGYCNNVDIFAFGKLMMEVITEINSDIKHNIQNYKELINLISQCVNDKASERPTITTIVEKLETLLD